MPRYAWNKSSPAAKKRYFELIRQGSSGSSAAREVGVSLSTGSKWFIDAGGMSFVDTPIHRRYFDQDDRIEIADGLASGESVKAIAVRIGKSYQSIYKEVARNRKPDGTYQPWYAHSQAHQRRSRPKPPKLSNDPGLRHAVEQKLELRWSPQQISRWLRRRWPRRAHWHVCAETIYQGAYDGLLDVDADKILRTGRTYRHRRGRGRSRDGALKQSTPLRSIHDRPANVEHRRRVGHWEGDLVIGTQHKSAIATLVDRKARYTILVPLGEDYGAAKVAEALIDVYAQLPKALRGSLTWDQGNEMFQHQRIESAAGVPIYFADPHAPWQRGTNENTNGLLRQYFPKGTDFRTISDHQLAEAAHQLNNRPRLCLDDRTPNQTMRRYQDHLMTI